MGRYRAPPPPSSKYITAEGAAALRQELDRLWRIERPAVTRAVAEAAAQGDRSENAEYIYGKKQLGAIDRRIRHLRKRLDGMRIVDAPPTDTSRVYFGAWFTLETASGERRRYRLVGPDEIDSRAEYVSIDSPLGKAVLGRAPGQQVLVSTPGGSDGGRLVAVDYGRPVKRNSDGSAPADVQKRSPAGPGESSQGE